MTSIDKEKNVTDAYIVHPTIDKEAIRVVKTLNKWKPARRKNLNTNSFILYLLISN